MRIDERRVAAHYLHAVARELVGDDRPLARYDQVYASEKLRRGRPLRCARRVAVRTCRGGGEVQDCLAKGLAGDRAGGEAHSSDLAPALDQGNTPAQLRRLNGAALARRTTANGDEIVVEGIAH